MWSAMKPRDAAAGRSRRRHRHRAMDAGGGARGLERLGLQLVSSSPMSEGVSAAPWSPSSAGGPPAVPREEIGAPCAAPPSTEPRPPSPAAAIAPRQELDREIADRRGAETASATPPPLQEDGVTPAVAKRRVAADRRRRHAWTKCDLHERRSIGRYDAAHPPRADRRRSVPRRQRRRASYESSPPSIATPLVRSGITTAPPTPPPPRAQTRASGGRSPTVHAPGEPVHHRHRAEKDTLQRAARRPRRAVAHERGLRNEALEGAAEDADGGFEGGAIIVGATWSQGGATAYAERTDVDARSARFRAAASPPPELPAARTAHAASARTQRPVRLRHEHPRQLGAEGAKFRDGKYRRGHNAANAMSGSPPRT